METPFGQLYILVSNENWQAIKADVRVIEMESEERFPVDGRWLIEVRVTPQQSERHIFTIRFTPALRISDACVETGEHLELKSWFSGNFKWSLGAVDEYWLRALRNVKLTEVNYLDYGITLRIDGIPEGEEFMLPFGVAWQETENLGDADTMFGASPADMYPPKWLQPDEK